MTLRAHRPVLLLAAVVLVSVNLRGAITAVAPVLPQIRADLGLSASAAGLLTTLPVLCFAVLAPVSAWLGRRIGPDRALLLSCIVIAAGTAGRVFGGVPILVVTTLAIGAAMTVGNVLVPVVVKRDFPEHAGSVTGLYTAALIAGAAAAAGLTAPVAAVTDWRFGLAIWAVLAVAAAIAWRAATRRPGEPVARAVLSRAASRAVRRTVWRSPLAWSVALLLGAQGAGYYAVTAWLPTLLSDEIGASLEMAGFAMSMFQLFGIAGTFLIAALATVRPQQIWLAVLMAACWTVMVAGLAVHPEWWPVWTVFGGVAQGAGITLALTLIALRSEDFDIANDLSAMAQLVGYTAAAAAPLVVGALHDVTEGWSVPLALLLALGGCIALAGTFAGRNETISVPSQDPSPGRNP